MDGGDGLKDGISGFMGELKLEWNLRGVAEHADLLNWEDPAQGVVLDTFGVTDSQIEVCHPNPLGAKARRMAADVYG